MTMLGAFIIVLRVLEFAGMALTAVVAVILLRLGGELGNNSYFNLIY